MYLKESQIIFLDIETSGLSIEDHEILEIAALVTDFNLKEIDRFVFKTRAEHIENAQPVALETIHYDPDVWEKEAVPLKVALEHLTKMTPRGEVSIPAGHNIKLFDVPFIRKQYERLKLFCNLSYHIVDTLDLAVAYQIASGKKFPNVRLGTLTKALGIEHEKAHTAMCDVEANLEVFKEFVGLMKVGYQTLYNNS